MEYIADTEATRKLMANSEHDVSGQVGYTVRPSERRKGYAHQMLAFAVDYCHTLGISDINISCLTDNEASKKTILSCGGRYRDTVHEEKYDIQLERYLI